MTIFYSYIEIATHENDDRKKKNLTHIIQQNRKKRMVSVQTSIHKVLHSMYPQIIKKLTIVIFW